MTPFPSLSRLCIAAWGGRCEFQPITLIKTYHGRQSNNRTAGGGSNPPTHPRYAGGEAVFPCGVPPSMRRPHLIRRDAGASFTKPACAAAAAAGDVLANPSPSFRVRTRREGRAPRRICHYQGGEFAVAERFQCVIFSFFARAVAAWPWLRPVTAAAPGRSGIGCGRRFHLLVALASRRVLFEVRALSRLSTCGARGVRLAGSAPSFGVAFAARSWDGRYRAALSAPGAFTSPGGVFLTPSSPVSGSSLSPTGDRRMPCPF